MPQFPNNHGIPVSVYRGGTSKALFFHENTLPAPGLERDALLKRIMGSPDPLQIDGMGGSKAVTSKIAIINKSARDGVDIDYTFVQIGIADHSISSGGNCGNISAAVGPFAIDEGLVDFRPGTSLDSSVRAQEVRIYNTGTRKRILAHVSIDENGRYQPDGNYEIAGVPGSASSILMDYRGSIGAVWSRGILPSGSPIDTVNVGGKDVQVTVCDVANPCVFVNAHDFNITGYESAAVLTSNKDWREKCQELRGKVAVLLSLVDYWKAWGGISSFAPLPVLLRLPETLRRATYWLEFSWTICAMRVWLGWGLSVLQPAVASRAP